MSPQNLLPGSQQDTKLWNLLHLAETFHLQKDYQSALNYYTDVIDEIKPEDPEDLRSVPKSLTYILSWAYAHRGLTYHELSSFIQALDDFNMAICYSSRGGESRYSWAYAHRAETKFYMGKYADAKEDFDKAIYYNNKYSWAYAHRGMVYRFIGGVNNYQNAVKDFSRAVEINTSYTWAWAYLSVVYILLAEALELEWQKYQEIFPHNSIECQSQKALLVQVQQNQPELKVDELQEIGQFITAKIDLVEHDISLRNNLQDNLQELRERFIEPLGYRLHYTSQAWNCLMRALTLDPTITQKACSPLDFKRSIV
jgi:tetratricopeptide (TPR) repeat protein